MVQRRVNVGAKSRGREMMAAMEEEVRREKEGGGERRPEVGGCEARAHTLRGRLQVTEAPL